MQKFLSLEEVFLECKNLFLAHGIVSAHLDASLILSHFAQSSFVDMMLYPQKMIAFSIVEEIRQAAYSRIAGRTVHRILGFREFYSLPLELSDFTLEPRPDTEILVDSILPFIRQCVQEKGECTVLDLGTGTGAIGLALVSQEVHCRVIATDISVKALEVAHRNADRLGFSDRFLIKESNWFENIVEQFDLIVSNPPYIKTAEIPLLAPEVYLCDPILALDGGNDGMNAYHILAKAFSHLKENGRIAVEIGFDQAKQVEEIFQHTYFQTVGLYDDLAGHHRVIVFRDLLKRSWHTSRERV